MEERIDDIRKDRKIIESCLGEFEGVVVANREVLHGCMEMPAMAGSPTAQYIHARFEESVQDSRRCFDEGIQKSNDELRAALNLADRICEEMESAASQEHGKDV